MNSDFLAVSNILISAKAAALLNWTQGKDASSHWTWVFSRRSACERIALFNVWYFITNIHDNPTFSLLILEHYLITPFKISVCVMGPWHLFVTLLIFCYSMGKWQRSQCFFTLVVVLVNCIEFKILVPVTNFSCVAVFWTTL